MSDPVILTDAQIDAMLAGVTTGYAPAGLPGAPNEDTPVSLTGVELVSISRMILTAHRQGLPLGRVQIDNARRIVRRARLLGMADNA